MDNMITDAILNIIFYVIKLLTWPIQQLSDVSLNSNFSTALTNAISYLANINNIIPIYNILLVLSAIITIEIAIAAYKLIMWVIRRIPTQS